MKKQDKTKDNSIISPTKIKNNRPLTRKQQAFVRYLIENPKASATQAVINTYDKTTYATAGQIASENLRKPQVVSELAKYNNLVENTLLNTVNDWGNSNKVAERALATDTAKYIHDKLKKIYKNKKIEVKVGESKSSMASYSE